MATIRSAFVDHSLLDGTGDEINGSEVDANPYLLADIMDGTTATQMNQSGSLAILNFEALDVSAAAGGIRTALRVRHDPASGTVTAADGPRILFEADDSAGNKTTIGEIRAPWITVTDGATEAAKLDFYARSSGASTLGLSLSGTPLLGVVSVGIGGAAVNTGFVTIDPPAFSSITTVNIARLNIENTAAITVPAGTTAIAASVFIGEPNLTATGTITSAVTLYVEAAPTEGGTNNYALWVDSGVSAFGGNLVPDANDGAQLGISGTAFSDLFLASGGVINFNAGDVTATHAANTLTLAGATSGYVFNDGNVYIGDTSNASSTLGLTLNQGAADNEILSLKSSDIAHGMTTRTETDTYGLFKKGSATLGGLFIEGYQEGAGQALGLYGYGTTDNTTHTAAGDAYIVANVAKSNGTGVQAPGANANLFAVGDAVGGIKFIVDQEGDLFADGSDVTVYDEYDDVAMLSTFDSVRSLEGGKRLMESEFEDFTKYNEQVLIDLDILGGPRVGVPASERGLINYTALSRLKVGAIRQLGRTINQQQSKIQELESRLTLLTERN